MGPSLVQASRFKPSTCAIDGRGACAVARACGGCPHIEAEPLLFRQQKLDSILQLLQDAGCAPERVDAYLEVSPLSYRNRIRLRVFDDGRFGFFNSEKSSSCVVLDGDLRTLLQNVRARLSHSPHLLKGYAHLELRAPDMNGMAGLLLTRSASGDSSIITLDRREHRESDGLGSIEKLGELLQDIPILLAESHGETIPQQKFALTDRVFQWVPLDGFMQVNAAINRALIKWLIEQARGHAVSTVADLYAGSGNFLIPLLAEGYVGVGVESNPSSVLSAQRSLVEQQLRGEVIHSDVKAWMRDNPRTFSLTVADAPRAGLRDLADAVAGMSSDYIAIVSCNPRSLVRDLVKMVSLGYVVQSLRIFDMFAYTDHVELGAWLHRRG